MIPSGKAKLAGVMGWPIGHSCSPRLHGYWLAHHGIDGAYVPLPVGPEHLAQALKALPILGFAGVNLTIPHKEAAVAFVDRLEPRARRAGAVNTIIVRDTALIGDNTDGLGFLENLRAAASGWRPAAGPAVVLGAGGTARAVVAALLDVGVPEIRLINRTTARAEAIADALGGQIRVRDWSERDQALESATLLVNTTALGMVGAPRLALALDALPPHAVVNDVVYTPLETELLAAARARGHPAVDGLGMLLHQARPGFAAWFGVEPAVTPQLRAFVLQGLQESV